MLRCVFLWGLLFLVARPSSCDWPSYSSWAKLLCSDGSWFQGLQDPQWPQLLMKGSAVAPAADETNDLAEATCVIRHRRGWDDGGDDPQFETAFETSRCEMNQHIQTGVLMTLFMTPGSWEWDAFFWELVLHHHWCYMGSRFSHLRLLPPGFMSLSLGVSFFAYLISLAEHTYQPKKRLSAGRNWKKMEGRTCRRKSFRQKHRVSF